MAKGTLIQDTVTKRDYSTLLSLISSNKGDYDICALVWDVCTYNFELYLEETITQRLQRLQEISHRSFEDLKRIIYLIKDKYVSFGKKDKESTMVVIDESKRTATFVSSRFDAALIYEEIEAFYRGGFVNVV